MVTQNSETVFRLLKLVEGLVFELESGFTGDLSQEGQQERWRYIFGEKETVVSALVKLAGILTKIIPMEQDIMTIINKSEEKKIQDLSEEDMEIIKRYLAKVKESAALDKDAGIDTAIDMDPALRK